MERCEACHDRTDTSACADCGYRFCPSCLNIHAKFVHQKAAFILELEGYEGQASQPSFEDAHRAEASTGENSNIFEITEEIRDMREKTKDSLSHLLGSKSEEVRLLPDLPVPKEIEKEARRNFTEMEKISLIEEDGRASNKKKLDIKGTHYENQSAADIAMQILPLKGL